MARKEPTFRALIEYFNRDKAIDAVLTQNFWDDERLDTVVSEFEDNYQALPKRKNGNALYHEIISLRPGLAVSIDHQVQALFELGREYLSNRAPDQLAYGVIHTEKNHLHLHLCISSNACGSRTRQRLSKSAFAEIQKHMERFQQERFPELGRGQVYQRGGDINAERHVQRSGGEQHVKAVKKKRTVKDRVGEAVDHALERSQSHAALREALVEEGLKLYCRAGTWGVERVSTGRKYRLRTLGLDTSFAAHQKSWEVRADNQRQLETVRAAQHLQRERQQQLEDER